MFRIVRVMLLLLVTTTFVGCTQTGTDAATGNTLPGHASVDKQVNTATDDSAWQEHRPGGDTQCSDGTDYKFWVRPGNAQQVVFYLQGGGGCWNRANCDPAMQPSYNINLNNFHPSDYDGVFDFANPANPLANHTVVFVPYCTGDVHLGAEDYEYPAVAPGQSVLPIAHRGLANAGSALAWTHDNYPRVDSLLVSGSSAGAIPSPYYAMQLALLYPDARVTQLGDGAGGYRRTGEGDLPHTSWGTVDALRSQPGFADLTDETFNYEQLYIRAAKVAPQIQFARYDSAEDSVQKRFLAFSGIRDVKLLDFLLANEADIAAQVPKFVGYIAGGESHTILGRKNFYHFTVGDRTVADWVGDLVAGDQVEDIRCTDCLLEEYAGAPMVPALRDLWLSWEDPKQQLVEPFQIFDNLYYVGIDWVAAYILKTSDGLILIDALYGKWVNQLYANMRQLGLDPADIKYVLLTHGHFDHAAGAYDVQRRYGARVVMTQEDWLIAESPAEHPLFASPAPKRDIVAKDGDIISLGDTEVELFNTPGHTTGVLSMRYAVRDGDHVHNALTLGGVGLNFSGVAQTESYLASYRRLIDLQKTHNIAVSLPNHAAMGDVFARRDLLAARQPQDPHPFVEAESFALDLAKFLAAAEEKLVQERAGTAANPLEALTKVLDD